MHWTERSLAVAGLSEERQDEALATVGRLDALTHVLLWSECNAVSPARLHALLADTYPMVDQPGRYGVRTIVRAFRKAGFVTDTADECRPSEARLIYRGIQRAGRPRGLSWTTDPERARWFARRFPSKAPGAVWQAEIDPQHVLAILHGRNEAEVVVDPLRLRRVALVEDNIPSWA